MKHSVQKALFLMEHGKINDAIKEFSFVLKDDPDNIPALTGKARCLIHYIYNRKKIDEGYEIMNKIILELEHESPEILLLKVKFLWRKKQHNNALTQIEYIKNTWGSELPELLFTEARILASGRIKRFKEALKLSEKLSGRERYFIQGNVDHIKALSAKNYEEKIEHHKNALDFFQRSFEIDFAANDEGAVDNFIISCKHINDEEHLNMAIFTGMKFIAKNPQAYILNKIVINTAYCIKQKFENTFDEIDSINLVDNDKSSYNLAIKEKRKEIAKEYTDFTQYIQTNQREFFEPEKIDYVMTRLFNPESGKPEFYNIQGLHREAITALNEFKFHSANIYKNNFESKFTESNFFFEFGWTYQHILEHKKAIEYYDKSLEIVEELILDMTNEYKVAYYSNLANTLEKILECCRILGEKQVDEETVEVYLEKKNRYIRKALEHAAILKIEYDAKNQTKLPPKYPSEEGDYLELKSSFFLHDAPSDMNKQERNAKEEKGFAEIAESVCAFLNTDGGDIIIGVDDETKDCLGIDEDIQKTKNKTYDAYTQTITNKVYSFLNEKYPNFINFGCISHPDNNPDEQVRLYRIFVQPLPKSEPYPSTITVGKSPSIVYYRTGDSDASYKYEDGMREWNRRRDMKS